MYHTWILWVIKISNPQMFMLAFPDKTASVWPGMSTPRPEVGLTSKRVSLTCLSHLDGRSRQRWSDWERFCDGFVVEKWKHVKNKTGHDWTIWTHNHGSWFEAHIEEIEDDWSRVKRQTSRSFENARHGEVNGSRRKPTKPQMFSYW